ncbi:glycosyltransferase family 2 protein [Natrinema gelatinilyticum]|uniref:glycosyltransferase family 2 protein n=1 Tax=Natrinema gelatinilyticum TaxID=2961571 RepID=UPI0020C3E31A|nr:glycosyltransferase family 2 protein [Natrinema gelatinilyticum]
MYKDNRIGVVVTAYDEATFVGRVIETVPEYVDRIYAVDDRSPDESWEVIQRVAERINRKRDRETAELELTVADGGDDRRVVPIRHEQNRGYGAAVKTGYRRAAADGLDVVAVMNGDGQMDPAILDRIIDPVVTGDADYAKGNRLLSPEDRDDMSTFRFIGNVMLTGLSKFATGYWSIGDTQNGYTAISRDAIEALDLEEITDRYGFLNHILTHLNVAGRRVADVPMYAVYGDEKSSIRYASFINFVSRLLLRSFCWRLKTRYVVQSFNPAVVYYGAGTIGLLGGFVGLLGSVARAVEGKDGFISGVSSFVAALIGLVSLCTAIRLDAEASEELTVSGADWDDERSPAVDDDDSAVDQSIE